MNGKRIYKRLLMIFWLAVIAGGVAYLAGTGAGFKELLAGIESFIRQAGPWAPLTYIGFYSFRSLFFVPASLLTILAGILFGPWFGLIFTIIGENISANLSFIVGRYFMKDYDGYLEKRHKFLDRTLCTTRKNGFISVLFMRLAFLPFDLVGYFSGACNIRQKHFALATLLGTIPGLFTYTLLGGSVRDINFLFIALATLAISLLIALILRRSKWIMAA